MTSKRGQLRSEIETVVNSLTTQAISDERKAVLQPLIDFILIKLDAGEEIRINFICTHNSRRSHFAQVWAQTMAHYFGIEKVFCYSGGTEATELFPSVVETLRHTGFKIDELSEGLNPIYGIKYAEDEHPIIGFSKKWNNSFNPKSGFAAVVTCSQAEDNCPLISGAEQRISITYEDPKEFDNLPQKASKYYERNLQIATELHYVFSKLN